MEKCSKVDLSHMNVKLEVSDRWITESIRLLLDSDLEPNANKLWIHKLCVINSD